MLLSIKFNMWGSIVQPGAILEDNCSKCTGNLYTKNTWCTHISSLYLTPKPLSTNHFLPTLLQQNINLQGITPHSCFSANNQLNKMIKLSINFLPQSHQFLRAWRSHSNCALCRRYIWKTCLKFLLFIFAFFVTMSWILATVSSKYVNQ